MNDDRAPSPATLGAMMIADVLDRWPATAEVFHANAMACVGCAVAPFFSVHDAAVVYGLPPAGFIEQLLQVIDGRPPTFDDGRQTTDHGPQTTDH